MDSLTQIVLGAAVGEAALGRKIGNRAMIWGAIGGTIPDLDVMSNLFMGELAALCAHRGITHSIFFSLLAPLAFAWLLSFLYRSGAYRTKGYKAFISLVNTVVLILIVWGVFKASGSIPVLILSATFAGYLLWRLYRYYIVKQLSDVEVSFKEWYILFFLAFFTHIALDCFTTYGTQVFLPFSNERVAFNTISVVDPLYTVPFIIFLVSAATRKKGLRIRTVLNRVGIGVSSVYLLFTVFNRAYIDSVFSGALDHRHLDVERQMVSPTIFQNILWNCVAESDSAYYVGLYSLFDTDPNLHILNTLQKDLEATAEISDTREYEALNWFSDGYLQVTDRDSFYELYDLRFGPLGDTVSGPEDYVFRFVLKPVPEGMEFSQIRNDDGDMKERLSEFFDRVKGY
jgi:inner membrane protein